MLANKKIYVTAGMKMVEMLGMRSVRIIGGPERSFQHNFVDKTNIHSLSHTQKMENTLKCSS